MKKYRKSLSERKIEQLKNMPLIQQRIFKSKDGRFVVTQTRISSIKPVEYFEKVLEAEPEEESDFFFD